MRRHMYASGELYGPFANYVKASRADAMLSMRYRGTCGFARAGRIWQRYSVTATREPPAGAGSTVTHWLQVSQRTSPPAGPGVAESFENGRAGGSATAQSSQEA
eukprot:365698-Chlamydomonas_euryale.AAC.6